MERLRINTLKVYTFALLSYGDEDRNIKIEINTRGVDESIMK